MTGLHRIATILALALVLAPTLTAQDLTRYRDFRFGMSLDAVTKLTQQEGPNVTTVHTKPALIQTFQWTQQGFFSAGNGTDPVRNIRFDFYDNQLFRIVVTYGSRPIEGLTPEDLTESISKLYGTATHPDETVAISAFASYEDRQNVVARWENDENRFTLFRSSYGNEFGLIGESRKLVAATSLAIREAQRLEILSAPQREVERRQKDAEERRIADEKARSVNKPNFRP